MKAQKWNFKTKKYADYDLPKGCLLIAALDEDVACADCGVTIKYGDSFTSRAIHSPVGFGYPVCEVCYNKEWKEERAKS